MVLQPNVHMERLTDKETSKKKSKMKKVVFAILMATLVALPSSTLAQKHRHTPRTENTVVPSSSTPQPSVDADTAGIELFSDTTNVDTTDVSTTHSGTNGIDWEGDWDSDEDLSPEDVLGLLGLGVSGTALGIVAVIFALFIIALPFLGIALIVWLIVRSRNRRYRIAEKAVESGQPIPDQLMEPEKTDMWQRGIKNIFLGLGLAVLFYCFGMESLAGIGWLVAICGVGQAVIGKTSQRRNNRNDIQQI